MFIYYVQADLSKPETIPATLVGIHTVIDCATGRPEEPIKTVSIHTALIFFKKKRVISVINLLFSIYPVMGLTRL